VQDLDVTFAVDRAGVVGADGATHTGNFDVAYCRCIPGIIMMAPADAEDMFKLLNTAYHYPGPALVRYPRDSTARTENVNVDDCVEIGTALQVRSGKKTALLVFGSLLASAKAIAEDLDLSLVNMRFIKPNSRLPGHSRRLERCRRRRFRGARSSQPETDSNSAITPRPRGFLPVTGQPRTDFAGLRSRSGCVA
jgi:transketolase C-terminal domain/subunit